ncbi:MAG: flagellar export chaperone FlgN [Ilumatobacter sp.]
MDLFDQLTRRMLLLHDQMEQLVCALDIQQLVLANNRLRWLPAVSENVEVLVEEIKISETERVPIARSIAQQLGLSAEASLADLAEAAGEPYRTSWRRTRLQLIAFQQEIEMITATNRDLGQHGAAAASDVINRLGDDLEPTAYSANGQTEPVRPAPHRFNRTA